MNTPKFYHFCVQSMKSSRILQAIENNSMVFRKICQKSTVPVRNYTIPSTPGSGAGKGGGAGGSIRESGGGLGQLGAAHEEEFFYHRQRQQIEKMKEKMKKQEPKPPDISQKHDK